MTELSLTRIFSVTMYYRFAFMVISIALFGLSASGVYVFLMRDGWKDVDTGRVLATHGFAFAVSTVLVLAVLVKLRVGLTYTPSNIALMSLMSLLSARPFPPAPGSPSRSRGSRLRGRLARRRRWLPAAHAGAQPTRRAWRDRDVCTAWSG